MAKSITLKAEVREQTGSKAVRQLRRQGSIPAIIYGHQKEPVAIALDEHNFMEALHHGQRLMDLQLGGKDEKIIVKALQYDHLGRNVIHADLLRVDVKQMVKVTVPIELKGTAPGIHAGGIVETHINSLEIECKVTDIPEKIVISIKDMQLDDAIHARDIVLPEGVNLVTSPEMRVVSCHTVAEMKTTEDVEAAMPAAPEVIGKAEEAEEGEADAKEDKKEKKKE
jgi:large subunit ribosomal protein L25